MPSNREERLRTDLPHHLQYFLPFLTFAFFQRPKGLTLPLCFAGVIKFTQQPIEIHKAQRPLRFTTEFAAISRT